MMHAVFCAGFDSLLYLEIGAILSEKFIYTRVVRGYVSTQDLLSLGSLFLLSSSQKNWHHREDR